MALALDGVVQKGGFESKTDYVQCALTTANAHDVIIVSTESSGGAVSSIEDDSGLTWTLRKEAVFADKGFNRVLNEWWAIAPAALSSDTIKAHFAGGTFSASVTIFGISGADTSSPFDSNASVPAGSGVLETLVVSTNNANDFIFGCYIFGGPDFGAGWTSLNLNPADESCREYKIVAAAQSGLSIVHGAGTDPLCGIGDAIKAAATVAASDARNFPFIANMGTLMGR